jgi:hypothetical protein
MKYLCPLMDDETRYLIAQEVLDTKRRALFRKGKESAHIMKHPKRNFGHERISQSL